MNNTGQHKRVLIVEDDQPIAEMLTMMLEMEGYAVEWASSGKVAVTLLIATEDTGDVEPVFARRYLLGLLDLQLPDMDGVAMIKQAAEAGAELPPVVVLAAKRTQAVEHAAREISAAAVLSKPFQLNVLMETIAHVVV